MVKRRSIKPEKIKRVIVRGASWVGDAVMTVPALHELRRILPTAHITLATRSWAEGIFKDSELFDDMLVYDHQSSMGNLIKQISSWRRGHFDLAILFQNAFEGALISATARVPLRTGYATDGRKFLLTHPIPIPTWRNQKHEIFYYLNIISELEFLLFGTSQINDQNPVYTIKVSDDRKAEARKILDSNRAIPGRSLVALCPGSTNSRAKRWPSDRFATLADMLMEELNADVILIGAQEELNVTQEVVSQMKNQPIILTGKLKLDQTVSLLSITDLLITNDTGPAHIGAALGCPTLVMFGPTNPITTRPFSTKAEVIRHPPECAPCMLRDCPIDHRCMTAITSTEVFAKASSALVRNHSSD
jgi:heptosyltransferase II